MSNAKLITPDSITAIVNGITYIFEKSHIHFNDALQALKNNEWDKIPTFNITNKIKIFSRGNVKVENEKLFYNNMEIKGKIVTAILNHIKNEIEWNYLAKFLDNLMLNPSKKAIDELYNWLESGKVVITDDGHFLAYKCVQENYLSWYDNKTNNTPGEYLQMPRNQVQDDSRKTCSTGYHFCSFDYLQYYMGYDDKTSKIVLVKVNPQHVVSIPYDHQYQKGRACEYLILSDYAKIDNNNTDIAPIKTKNNNDFDVIKVSSYKQNSYSKEEILKTLNISSDALRKRVKRGKTIIEKDNRYYFI